MYKVSGMYYAMMLDDLKVTARLAHLGLREDELGAALPAFEQMLDYFAVMQTADGSSSAPVDGTAGIEAVHSDLVLSVHQCNNNNLLNNNNNNNAVNTAINHNENPRANNNLLNQAGERNGNFIVVPNVL